MIEWSGGVMPVLSKCYTGIISSQLPHGQMLQHWHLSTAQAPAAVTLEAILDNGEFAHKTTPTDAAPARSTRCGGILVVTDGVGGGFESKLVNHATTSRAIGKGDAESTAMQ